MPGGLFYGEWKMETEQNGQVAAPQTAAAPVVEQKPAEQPKLFAGKYKTTEELEKGYKALEAKLGEKPAPDKPAADKPAEQTPKTTQEMVNTPMGEEMLNEYYQTGAITDATLDKAAKSFGLPKEMIAAVKDTLVAQQQEGLKSIAASLKDDGVSPENIKDFIGHLDKTLSGPQKLAVQTMIEMKNFDALRPMAKAWAKTVLPAGQVGQTVNNSGGFSSKEEYFKAIRSANRDSMSALSARISATSPDMINAWNGGKK
ncbi:MAG: hypothetical protein ACREJO_00080 [Phycisphaerales bacterium]